MRTVSWICWALALAPWRAEGGVSMFDMGTDRSAVWSGARRVTVAERGEECGWRGGEGLRAVAKAYTEPLENASRGIAEPPPIWTNAITEDAITGERPDAFRFRVGAPGRHEVYVVCGVSDPSWRATKFDFGVRVGGVTRRVEIEGAQLYRVVRFGIDAGAAREIEVAFEPRNRWVVNAILAWDAAETARVEREIIAPFERWTFHLPPAEEAKWKEDPAPDPGPMPAVTGEETRRGFVVFAPSPFDVVYPGTRPRREDCDPELRLFASPGEIEPASFVVHPLKDLEGGTVTASDLGPVKADRIEVRRVRAMRARPNYTVTGRYRLVPDALERCGEFALRAGANERVWLTLRVPPDAAPGEYSGSVEFGCSGGRARIPMRLRILPIALKEDPSRLYGIYYRHPYDLMFEAKDDVSREHFRRRALLEHRDMLEHGTRNVVLSVWSQAADASGRFDIRWEPLAAKLELWKECGFAGPVVLGIPTGSVYAKHVKGGQLGSHLRSVQDPPESFCLEMTALVREIERVRVERGWPEFLYYPVDEPGTGAASVAFMVKVLRACKSAGVRTYVTADPTREAYEPMRPHVDVWCTQPFAPEREVVLADSAARGVEYWCYPNHVNGENDHTPVAGARMTYGFGFWRSGFRALIPWIYSSSTGDPFNYLDGYAMDFFNRHEPDGTPMPVLLWEAYREGYDDARYIFTLEDAIARARATGDARVREVADAAAAELRSTWETIRVQAKYKHDGLWAPAEFDVRRWMIARQILKVQEAMATVGAAGRGGGGGER